MNTTQAYYPIKSIKRFCLENIKFPTEKSKFFQKYNERIRNLYPKITKRNNNNKLGIKFAKM